jgi:hypothetical protein
VTTLLTSGPTANASPPDRESLRRISKELWDSLDTFAFRSEDYPVNTQGQPDRTRGYNRFDFTMASGGRRAMIATGVLPDGIVSIENMREDGRRTYRVMPFEDHPDAIERLIITNQVDTEDHYQGMMTMALWFLMPAGRPLYAHFDAGATLEIGQDDEHRDQVVLIIKDGERPVRCVLDSGHDWLPNRIILGDGVEEFQATSYARDNGRWFPEKILNTARSRGREEVTGCTVTNLRINRPVAATTFAPPALPKGAVVVDRIEGRSEPVGGLAAFKAHRQKHGEPTSSSTTERPLVAPQSHNSTPWSLIIALGSTLVLIVALTIRIRRGTAAA